uniref:Integrase catalytic domain-containing protein n=1 Tax=Fagus sylvatica TaxID=28930 RepID=A0A2N9EI16_FAGSY
MVFQEPPATGNSSWTDANQKEYKENLKKNATALRIIHQGLQNLWRDFDNLAMKETESVKDFHSRVAEIVNQIKSYGDTIQEKKLVEKILRSLPKKFDHVVAAIEESKDLSILSLYELMGSLEAHEGRMSRFSSQPLEQAFQSKETQDTWFLDSGCSSHMTMNSKSFVELDRSYSSVVKLRDGKLKKVEGKGTIAVNTNGGNRKFIHDVLYVPSLSQNLLSVGQLLRKGYSLLFDDGECTVYDKKHKLTVAKVGMSRNNVFPLSMPSNEKIALKCEHVDDSHLWHLRYGHLNYQGLQLLKKRNMVVGLPSIQNNDRICEGCIYGKMHRLPFPKTAWRARAPLELVHCRYISQFEELLSRMVLPRGRIEQLKKMARSMLKGKGLPNMLWAEAVHTAVYILNRSPTKAVRNKTPFEAWHKQKPMVNQLKVFGCIAYAHIPSQEREKFDEKGEKYIFIGYSDESKGFRLLNPKSNKLVVSRDVIFDEMESWQWEDNLQESRNFEVPTLDFQDKSNSLPNPNSVEVPRTASSPNRSPNTALPSSDSIDAESPPRKMHSLSDIYQSCEFALFSSEPQTFEDAIKENVWANAMNEEIASIERNQTWELVDLPNGREVIGLKWIYKTKFNEDGSIQKHKARLVAKGYAQQPGVDFHETFAPVVRMETIRTVLALAAQMELQVFQLDVKSAFLNGDLEEEVYVEQPKGYVKKGKEDRVYRLRKALYGLAPRAWNSKIDSYFRQNGFHRSKCEPSLYVKHDGTGRFSGACKPVSTPMSSNEKLQQNDAAEKADAKAYRSLVGSLIYLTNTRPDIVHSVSLISRFMNQPSKLHYATAKRILRYLQGTKKLGILYKKENDNNLVGFTDSDWVGSLDDRKSTSGYIFCLGSKVIAWSSKKQKTVALSSAEAEYIAANDAACEAVWLRKILSDLQQKIEEPTVICCDNMSAIAMTKNPVFHARTKHIELRHHFIRDLVSQGEIQLKFISTNDQPADILTKAATVDKIEWFKKYLKITN